jgi:hypothetical protein
MDMRYLFLLNALLVSGCGSSQPPIIDMTGVDQGQHSRDLAECTKAAGQKIIDYTPGGFVSSCMKDRGYKVLVNTS